MPTVPLGSSPSDKNFHTNSRGNNIDHILSSLNDLILFNKPRTRTTSGTYSAIDLTLCSKALAPKLSWRTHSDLCDSDHTQYSLLRKPLSTKNLHPSPPSLTNWQSWLDTLQTTHIRYRISAWSLWSTHCSRNFHPVCIINSAEISIPRTTGYCKPNQVPWRSKEISLAIKTRKKAHRKYKSTLLQSDFIEYKKAHAIARVLIRSAKEGPGAHLSPA